MTQSTGKITPQQLHRAFAEYLAPSVLIVVAALQIAGYFLDGRAAWKRGGFGMFTTVDAGPNRGISCEVTDINGAVYTVLLEKSLAEDNEETAFEEGSGPSLLTQFLKKPAQNLLKLEGSEEDYRAFARAILNNAALKKVPAGLVKRLQVVQSGGANAFYTIAPTVSDNQIQIQSVRLQLWRRVFSPDSKTFSWTPLQEALTVERP